MAIGYTEAQAVNVFRILRGNVKDCKIRVFWAAFTMISYRLAYLKAHYPVEFALQQIQWADSECGNGKQRFGRQTHT